MPFSAIENPLLPSGFPGNPEESPSTLQAILNNGLTIFLVGAAVVFLFIFLLGGVNYMTAGGDKEKKIAASARLTNALIGLVVILSIFVIMSLIGSLFNINLLKFSLPRL